MTDLEKDVATVAGLSFVKPLAMLGAFVAIVGFAYCAGSHNGTVSEKIAAQTQIVHVTDTVRQVAAETVTVKLKAQSRVDTLVRVQSDTQLVIRSTPAAKPETVTVKPIVVERIVTDDESITALRSLVHADSAAIHSRDVLLALPHVERRWSVGLSGGYGPQLEQDHAIRLGWHGGLAVSFRIF